MEVKERHYFYIVLCRDGSLYTGYTNNLERRIRMHNNGKGAKYTRGRGPVHLVFSKEFANKSEALKAEYMFKRKNRTQKEAFLFKETGGQFASTKEF